MTSKNRRARRVRQGKRVAAAAAQKLIGRPLSYAELEKAYRRWQAANPANSRSSSASISVALDTVVQSDLGYPSEE